MSEPLPRWASAWVQSKRDPLKFANGVLGIPLPGQPPRGTIHPLEPWQVKVFEALRDGHTRLSIRSGHGVKKSATLSIIVLWLLLTRTEIKVPVVAGSQDQLRDTLWPEVSFWHRQLPAELRDQLEVQAERIIVKASPDEAFAVARTASKDNAQAMAGFHSRNLALLCDEASAIHEAAYEVAQGALSTPGAIAILAGNPSRAEGFFHATHTKLRDRWWTLRVSSEEVPSARGHIADIIATYGRESNAYRTRVSGEFPVALDQAVIPLELVEAAIGRDVATKDVWPVIGLDVARHGDDSTALCLRQGNAILALKEWRNLDGAQVSGRVVSFINDLPIHLKPKEIVVDIIGVGAAVYDILRLPGSPVAEMTRGCNVAEMPSVSEIDHRLRDQLWFAGRQWFADRDCVIPKEFPDPADTKLIEKLVAELTGPTYDFTILGKRKVEAKADMKKRGVASPNIADAFLLSLAAGIYPRSNPHRRADQHKPLSWLAA
jgi:hypothetical protein